MSTLSIRSKQQRQRLPSPPPTKMVMVASLTLHLLLAMSLLASSTKAIRSIVPSVGFQARSRGRFGLLESSSRGEKSLLLAQSSTTLSSSCLAIPRGGSEAAADEQEDKEEAEEDNEKDNDGDDDEEGESKSKITSTEPIILQIKTNLNNEVVDIQSIEIMALRMRNIESIKKTLSRQLPGKPPLESIRLMQHGVVLREELLIDELMDDDDEEEDDEDMDDEENKPGLTLVLDMVPPVDPRSFSGALQENMDNLSTAELLEAYALNEAAIWFSSQSLSSTAASTDEEKDGDEEESATTTDEATDASPLISFQLRQYATTLKSQLQENALSEKAVPLLEDPVPPAQAAAELSRKPQVRGQRTRPAAALAGGGVPSSSVIGLKQTAQHYLNIVR